VADGVDSSLSSVTGVGAALRLFIESSLGNEREGIRVECALRVRASAAGAIEGPRVSPATTRN
jgi:hypothetical protein